MVSSSRDKRLISDYKALQALQARLNVGRQRIEIKPSGGQPPHQYEIIFFCNGYISFDGQMKDKHQVHLNLPANYPLTEPPVFKFKSAIVHPHVWDTGLVCLGYNKTSNPWKPFYNLDDLVLQIRKLIRFEPDSVNLSSRVPGHSPEAWELFMRGARIPADGDSIT